MVLEEKRSEVEKRVEGRKEKKSAESLRGTLARSLAFLQFGKPLSFSFELRPDYSRFSSRNSFWSAKRTCSMRFLQEARSLYGVERERREGRGICASTWGGWGEGAMVFFSFPSSKEASLPLSCFLVLFFSSLFPGVTREKKADYRDWRGETTSNKRTSGKSRAFLSF